MDDKPYNRGTQYSKSKEQDSQKDYYSLRSIASEIYPDLSEKRAYEKTLENFKEVCTLLGKDPEEFRPSPTSTFRIPASQKTGIIILIRHLAIYQAGMPFKDQDYKKISNFARDILDIKEDFDRLDYEGNAEDQMSVAELFYSSSDIRNLLTHEIEKELVMKLIEDFKYINEKVPADRTTLYAEHYQSTVKRAMNEASKYIRAFVEKELYKQ
ncbi:hypothetical protein QWJ34_08015 [Saccharibacillus sp. CPCC 101409]|uniref:hypothetical protein n=1 Tax=Saccharibacillus sp. CPCC 101409 TaxID=3058041 RepID=UPI0026712D9E|nr:hypothetical protein [Saccharibacillus sp. CPCC 101409]MDO3409707.1 hypothetical protein [Saccharibacillus sp. CPCC 101409]